MKKKSFWFLSCLFLVSCQKNNSDSMNPINYELLNYSLTDSVIKMHDGNVIIQENHYSINKTVSITKNLITGEIAYNNDTFIVYSTLPLTYASKKNSFPLLQFKNDSLTIYRHVSGVQLQTWEYLIGSKI